MSGSTLAGRGALVTGASRGVGLAVSRALSQAGARVAMVARTGADLARAAELVGGAPIPGDVSSPEDVERIGGEVIELLGGVPDVLVNSAGSFILAPFADTTPEDFERQLSVNLVGPFLVIRRFLPGMIERGAGHVVNIGSVAGRVPLPGNAAYGASKYGLRGLHEILSAELRGTGVRASLIEPAATDTPLWDAVDPDGREDLPSRSAMLRPEEVAAAVRFVLEQPEGVEVADVSIRATGERARGGEAG